MLRWRNTFILAKREATYGTDAVPTGAAAVLIRNATLSVIEGGTEDRPRMRPFLGAGEKSHVGVHRKTQFEVDLAGSGAAGTVPGYADLLRACGLAEVVTAGTSVVYTPVSDGFESVSLYFFKSGKLRKMLGSRGTVGISIAAKATPTLKFDIAGLYAPPATQAPPAAAYTGYRNGLPVSKTNTPVFTLGGVALALKALDINLGNTVGHRDLVNRAEVAISDRAVTATATFEWPDLGDLDVEAKALPAADGSPQTLALALQHGTAAGNIVEIGGPRVQLTEPKEIEDEGIVMCQCNLTFLPTPAGNDELVLTIR